MRNGYIMHIRNVLGIPPKQVAECMSEAESEALLDEILTAGRRMGWRIPGEA